MKSYERSISAMHMLPGVIIIGTMKGGTSSLFRYLYSHPELSGSRIKETNFFAEESKFASGKSWYESLFQNDGKIHFEASPKYAKRHLFPEASGRIFEMIPNVKLIYLVRDPIDRTVSHYIHSLANGREIADFSSAIRTHSSYIDTSRYFFQLEPYLELFEKEKILVMQSERLRLDRENAMREIAGFIGISVAFDRDVLSTEHHLTKRKKRSSRLEHHLRPFFKLRFVYPFFLAAMRPFRTEIESPKRSTEDLEYLSEQFGPDVEKLRRHTGLELPGWKV